MTAIYQTRVRIPATPHNKILIQFWGSRADGKIGGEEKVSYILAPTLPSKIKGQVYKSGEVNGL